MVAVLLTRRSISVTLNRKDNCLRTDPTRYLPNDSPALSALHNMSTFLPLCERTHDLSLPL